MISFRTTTEIRPCELSTSLFYEQFSISFGHKDATETLNFNRQAPYLTVIPRAPKAAKGSESTAHEAENRMGY